MYGSAAIGGWKLSNPERTAGAPTLQPRQERGDQCNGLRCLYDNLSGGRLRAGEGNAVGKEITVVVEMISPVQ